ncbi:MAG TPA: hypothetical protein VMV59_10385 [Candidatus Dormibacteraeota bacterium]|nr:hypothetical protein [Candidatus Dormibacteraeota bacterium]
MAGAVLRMSALRIALPTLGMLFFSMPLTAQTARVQKEIAKDKANYERQTKPVGRAKAVVKLGRAEYLAARQSLDAGNIRSAFEFLADYNEQAIAAHDALEKLDVDPEKHSNGFRQLQISVRESLRQLREIIGRVPLEQQESFQKLEEDLDALNQKLILELFPRQPGHKVQDQKKHNEVTHET